MKVGVRAFRAKVSDYLKIVAQGNEMLQITSHGRVLANLIGPTGAACDCTASIHNQDTNAAGQKLEFHKERSRELRLAAEQKMRELAKLDWDGLASAYTSMTSIKPDERLTERDVQLTIARIYQLRLWVDQLGAVPEDIATRDLRFWLRLLQTLSLPATTGEGPK